MVGLRRSGIVLLAVAAVLASAPGALAQADTDLQGRVQIGALVPVTGDGSGHGVDIRMSIGIAEDDFNMYLEEIGEDWTLDVVVEDTGTNPAVALEKLTDLRAKGIEAVAGTYSSAELRNVRGYSDSNGMMLISFGSTAPSLAIPGDNVYRFIPNDLSYGPLYAKLFEGAGVTNVVPIWRGDAWGEGVISVAKESFADVGGVMDEGVRYNPEAVEFSVEAAALSDLVGRHVDEVGADRVAVLQASFNEAVNIAQSASQYDNLAEVRWIGSNALVGDQEIVDDPLSSRFYDDAGIIAMQFAPTQTPTYQRVSSSIENAHGSEPAIYAMLAYDVVWAFGLSILAGGSADADSITRELPGVLEGYEGATGKVELNEAGDRIVGTQELWSTEDGEWVLVGSYDPVSDSIMWFAEAEGDEEIEAEEPAPEGGCLVATAAYGTELAPQVQMLRELRDGTLLRTPSGSSFMAAFNQVYYSFSPAVADLQRENPAFRELTKAAIAPAVHILGVMSHADSEESVILLGIVSLGAMAGVYVAGPSLAAYAVYRRSRGAALRERPARRA